MRDAAEHHAKAALDGPDRGAADDAAIVMACQTLASIQEARGESAAAARILDRAYGRQSLFHQPAPGADLSLLVLLSRHAGNIPYAALAPSDLYDRWVWCMEHARPEQLDRTTACAVVLNAIGDADVAQASEKTVEAILAKVDRPLLNQPARVSATRRDRLAETLAGIADCIVPGTARLDAQSIGARGLAGAVAAAGFAAPVLLRPPATHGGAGLVLANTTAALEALSLGERGDLYVSAFHDYRSPDGYFRKYRVIFVDRRAFPYHLAIGRRWMVHHQTSDMAEDPMRMAEELHFLADPAGVLGPRAFAAVEAIGRRLDLDYAGVDFTVLDDGRVLVFEANAAMLTHLEAEDGPFAAKNRFVQPIIDAFQAHLRELARRGALPAGPAA